MEFETLQYSVADGVAHITLNRPDSANALNPTMGREFRIATAKCADDATVRAVLITSTGKMFCAGGDLRAFADMGASIGAELKQLADDLHMGLSRLLRGHAPVVVAVQGAAAGAGFPLAMIGDIVLASERASFTMAYTAAGLSPDGGSTYLLPRLIGLRKAQELTLLNRRLSAHEAEAWGLITRVVDGESLLDEAWAVARQLAAGPTAAYASARRLLWSSLGDAPETHMEIEGREIAANAVGIDGTEGIAAFVAKRAPAFRGTRVATVARPSLLVPFCRRWVRQNGTSLRPTAGQEHRYTDEVAKRAEDLWYITRQEYLAAERVASTKSEWVDGVVYNMAGASKRHVAVVTRLVELFAGPARQRGCLIGSNDLLVETANANYYPDVVASCDPSADPYIEHNPCFIAEVLSPSTNRTDRVEKRDAFLTIASMQTYWIVDPDTKVVEVWERTEDGWGGRHATAADVVSIACLDASVRVVDIVGV